MFDEVNGPDRGYKPFDGIVLTDTFESTERESTLDDDMFGTNNERLRKQQETPITAIISNPPYSGRQKNENDENENLRYPVLDDQIENTYVKKSTAKASHAVYDSYIRAIRWASNRIDKKGIIGFITSNSYIDARSLDGLRSCLHAEFNHLYVFNLKGAIRGKVGIDAKKEGENIFPILTGVAIILLIKDDSNIHEIKYAEIEDFSSKKQKLDFLKSHFSFAHIATTSIVPSLNNDWINKERSIKNPIYIYDEKNTGKGIFYSKEIGINTKRDKWVYGYSSDKVLNNSLRMIRNYNAEVAKLKRDPKYIATKDNQKISWSDELKKKYKKGQTISFIGKKSLVKVLFRPFTKKYLYLDKEIIARPGNWKEYNTEFPTIIIPGKSNRRSFSALVANVPIDQNIMDAGAQTFCINQNHGLFNVENIDANLVKKLGLNNKDLMPYIYSLLNSPIYKKYFYGNLKKNYPLVIKTKFKDDYIDIGRKLMSLHLNYEEVPVYDKIDVHFSTTPNYKVERMRFPKKRNDEGKNVDDKSTIKFNDSITISNIPEKAYNYIVNGKSAIEWIMDQYRVNPDRKSGITDDPNDYSDDPKYIFNLLLRIINVSVQTVDLINQLPKLEIEE